jgi:restriction endonuclease Mrr
MNVTFHYPPELISLLIDTIPLLFRSKMDTLLFFKGAGVDDVMTADILKIVETNRESITKFEIVRRILTRLNERGEPTLRERREVLKRVVEFEDFSSCWPDDQLKAKGLVAEIRHVVGVKDSFTRMNEERTREREQHRAKREETIRLVQQRNQTISQLKDELFALFGESDTKKRGKALESVLNRLFQAYDISVRNDFTLVGDLGEGVVEQIDGVIELDGHLYFVEMKWWKEPVGVPEISQHMMRVFLRAEARAIIISASDFTAPAVTTCKEALSQKIVTLCTLEEIVRLLDQHGSLPDLLRRKVDVTIMDKNPFPKVTI